MITKTTLPWADGVWRRHLAEAVGTVEELVALLDLPVDASLGHDRTGGFRLRVPRGFVQLMERGNPRDPLLLQVLPRAMEEAVVAGFTTDPVGEAGLDPGLLRKYHGRALLVTTGACPVHCRYCFRRHHPYEERSGLATSLDEIRSDSDLEEVILSGGDPLSLGNRQLAGLFGTLAGIEHISRVRIHSRWPVVLPERIDGELLKILATSKQRVVLVIHANHAAELGDSAALALAALRDVGVVLLNQSVLLAGVNDSVAILEALSLRLFDLGVQPYYLHDLDPVAGAAHFRVDRDARDRLYAGLIKRLSGYLVPRLVREVPHAMGKWPLPVRREMLEPGARGLEVAGEQ